MMRSAHILELEPLPAYTDITCETPLNPFEYRARLPGSIVKVTVSFIAYKFGFHALSPIIDEMTICAQPLASPSSPAKKRFKSFTTNSSKGTAQSSSDSPAKRLRRV